LVRIIISGCSGKMGHVVAGLCSKDDQVTVVAGFDKNTTPYDSFPIFETPAEYTGEGDVIIDFSHPSCLENLLAYAKEKKIPAIICTTGLSAQQVESIHEAAKEVPIFFSANMSLGINLIIDLVKRAAKVLEENYDIEIIEKHHNQKLDAPSGTALAIADAISTVLTEKPEYVYDRHSYRKKREKNEIGIHAIRGGNIVGDHDVLFAGNNELIQISHTATSREVFAEGAVRAAKFMVGKEPGLYNMTQLVESYN
jgi:4-hydroxy-tetrahydrodipicolinate reductase